MKKIPLRWVMLAGIVYLTLMVIFTLAFVFPQGLKIKELKAKLHSFEGSRPLEEQQLQKEVAALRKGLRETEALFEKRLAVPEEPALTRLLNLSQKARVRVLSVAPFSSTTAAKNTTGQVSIKMVFTGNYRQILDFVHLLESDRALFRIEKMTLSNTEKLHQGEIDIVTYLK